MGTCARMRTHRHVSAAAMAYSYMVYIKCAHAKMHWLLVRSSMVKFIPFYRELGILGIVFGGSGYYYNYAFLYISLYLSSHQQREQKQNRHLCFI